MTLTIRRSEPADHPAIISLMDASRGEGLSAEERSERGFVQGVMTPEALAVLEGGPGIFVAVEDGALAGFVMSSQPETTRNVAARTAVSVAAGELDDPSLRLFLYGPAAVSADFQGRGILSKLLTKMCADLAPVYDVGVAMVEASNKKSMAVHGHYGMRRTAPYEVDGRQYFAFSFPTTLFTERG
jgi:ribosomal protein S18 acetylase RimI-like enzyme